MEESTTGIPPSETIPENCMTHEMQVVPAYGYAGYDRFNSYNESGMIAAGGVCDLRHEVGEVKETVKSAESEIRRDIAKSECDIRHDIGEVRCEVMGVEGRLSKEIIINRYELDKSFSTQIRDFKDFVAEKFCKNSEEHLKEKVFDLQRDNDALLHRSQTVELKAAICNRTGCGCETEVPVTRIK